MSYEDSVAAKLLATQCACCARPLTDAKSVETGMGKTCRKNHGFDKPDALIDFEVASKIVGMSTMIGMVGVTTTRDMANRLTYRIAAEQDSPNVPALVNALRSIGFTKLADRIADRLVSVTIEVVDGGFFVQASYSEEHVEAMRQVPGRRFQKREDNKGDFVPEKAKRALFAALVDAHLGQYVHGPKGVFVVARAT